MTYLITFMLTVERTIEPLAKKKKKVDMEAIYATPQKTKKEKKSFKS